MGDNKPDGRRHDIDALRVFSFGTLIIFHTSLMYGSRTWHVNASADSRIVDLISLGSHPWRMSLLFFISGLVTASLLNRKPVGDIRRARTRQLLVPFLFGVLLIVPPQIYFSDAFATSDMSYWVFLKAYMSHQLPLEHMWFLAYLWIYTFIWLIVLPGLRRYWPRLPEAFASMLKGYGLFLLPILFLSALRLGLYPTFGETLVISTDLYAHAMYFAMFVAGSLLMNERGFWAEVDRQRWASYALTAISFVILATIFLALPRDQWPDWLVVIARVLRSVFQWCAILALLALAGRLASRPSKVVRYLNASMMTYYVVHQTVIVMIGYTFARFGMLDGWSFIPVMLITVASCLFIAEVLKFSSAQVVPRVLRLASSIRALIKPAAPGAVG